MKLRVAGDTVRSAGTPIPRMREKAAVGVGVTTILFFLTLRRIHELKGTKDE